MSEIYYDPYLDEIIEVIGYSPIFDSFGFYIGRKFGFINNHGLEHLVYIGEL